MRLFDTTRDRKYIQNSPNAQKSVETPQSPNWLIPQAREVAFLNSTDIKAQDKQNETSSTLQLKQTNQVLHANLQNEAQRKPTNHTLENRWNSWISWNPKHQKSSIK